VSAARKHTYVLFSDTRVAAAASLVTDRAGSVGAGCCGAIPCEVLSKVEVVASGPVGSRLRACSACPYGQMRVCVLHHAVFLTGRRALRPGLRPCSGLLPAALHLPHLAVRVLCSSRVVHSLLSSSLMFVLHPTPLASPLHLPTQSAQSSQSTPSSLIAPTNIYKNASTSSCCVTCCCLLCSPPPRCI
jgi:hypothetical protein